MTSENRTRIVEAFAALRELIALEPSSDAAALADDHICVAERSLTVMPRTDLPMRRRFTVELRVFGEDSAIGKHPYKKIWVDSSNGFCDVGMDGASPPYVRFGGNDCAAIAMGEIQGIRRIAHELDLMSASLSEEANGSVPYTGSEEHWGEGANWINAT